MTLSIWLAPQELILKDKGILWSCLSEKERRRYEGFGSLKRQQEFLLGRGLLRCQLSHLYEREPQEWHLTNESREPLELLDFSLSCPQNNVQGTPLYVNISHSQHLLVSVVSSTPVGLDLEIKKPRQNFARLAEEFMTEDELESLHRFHEINSQKAAHYFYQLWTAKEALYKSLTLEEQAKVPFRRMLTENPLTGLKKQSDFSISTATLEHQQQDYSLALFHQKNMTPAAVKMIQQLSPVENSNIVLNWQIFFETKLY